MRICMHCIAEPGKRNTNDFGSQSAPAELQLKHVPDVPSLPGRVCIGKPWIRVSKTWHVLKKERERERERYVLPLLHHNRSVYDKDQHGISLLHLSLHNHTTSRAKIVKSEVLVKISLLQYQNNHLSLCCFERRNLKQRDNTCLPKSQRTPATNQNFLIISYNISLFKYAQLEQPLCRIVLARP